MLLNKKNILITGASHGIGYVSVKKCLMEGANVILNYHKDFLKKLYMSF